MKLYKSRNLSISLIAERYSGPEFGALINRTCGSRRTASVFAADRLNKLCG